MAKIGLILPVYNAEKCLNRCLESINNQTFKDFEVLAIDDGSTDKSLEILENFKKTSNIKFTIHSKENGGELSCLIYALEKLDSEYITIVDDDDTIEPNYLLKLVECIEETNTNICNSRVAYHFDAPIINSIGFKNKKRKKIINLNQEKYYLPMINVTTWGKLYKHEYISYPYVPFEANSDLCTTYYLCAKAKNISFANDVAYHYYPTNEGAAHTYLSGIDWKKMQNTFLPLSELKRRFVNDEILGKYYSEIEQLFIKNIFQRVDYIRDNIADSKVKKQLIDTLYDYISFHFFNWQNNRYLRNNFIDFEIPDTISALKNKKNIEEYDKTIYDNENEIFEHYKKLSLKLKQK